jgi:hypothetical protein
VKLNARDVAKDEDDAEQDQHAPDDPCRLVRLALGLLFGV